MIGIYIHIPYCRTLCPYCDFVKKRTSGEVPEAFADALCREIEAYEGPRVAASVFFGGGTPSLLSPASLAKIMRTIGQQFTLNEAETTLEANPDDVTDAKAVMWRECGVNRVSLGVQSFDDRVLRYLGRRHDAQAAMRACETIATHFENWNLDLIFGARPVDAWGATLEQSLALNPPHVAAYGLTYEEGTPFARKRAEALEEDSALGLFQAAEVALAAYDHYEISNFAKPGLASRHNLVYWHNGEYAGFGTGAYSFLGGVRARNVVDTDAYLAQPGRKQESLVLEEREVRVETLIQYLRLRDGLPKAAYEARFKTSIQEDFGSVIEGLKARSLISEDAERICPTAEGFYLNNEIGLALVG